jgi:DNA-binding response OmpR family regulator
MSTLLLLTNALHPSAQVLPALSLLSHTVRVLPAEPAALLAAPPADAVLVDATTDLGAARNLCRLLRTTGMTVPLLLVVGAGGMAVVTSDWGMDDVLLASAEPAELAARLRLSAGRLAAGAEDEGTRVIRSGDVLIDDAAYTARAGGRSLDLTFKEFELLKFLVQHPGRVFSRQQLLQEVWGYDYFGGTRTVDVHVRRLRAKLGPEYEARIGTVRNVGYRFLVPTAEVTTPTGLEADEEASSASAARP